MHARNRRIHNVDDGRGTDSHVFEIGRQGFQRDPGTFDRRVEFTLRRKSG